MPHYAPSARKHSEKARLPFAGGAPLLSAMKFPYRIINDYRVLSEAVIICALIRIRNGTYPEYACYRCAPLQHAAKRVYL